jgi:hypothetical protein
MSRVIGDRLPRPQNRWNRCMGLTRLCSDRSMSPSCHAQVSRLRSAAKLDVHDAVGSPRGSLSDVSTQSYPRPPGANPPLRPTHENRASVASVFI